MKSEITSDENLWEITAIGSKLYDQLKNHYEVVHHIQSPEEGDLSDDVLSSITSSIMAKIEHDEFYGLRVYYNDSLKSISPILKCERILPIQPKEFNDEQEVLPYYKFEENILPAAIKSYMLKALQRVYLISRFSEEKSRMIAMDSASKNAGEIIDKLSLQLNRQRQAMITGELIEIISCTNLV